MRTLSADVISVLAPFSPLFTRTPLNHVQVLVCGAILAPGKRTVTAVLRVMGLSREKQFQKYHPVLNRAAWWSCSHTAIGETSSDRQASGLVCQRAANLLR